MSEKSLLERWYIGPMWAANAANFGSQALQNYQIYCQNGSELDNLAYAAFDGVAAACALVLGLESACDGIQKAKEWYRGR